MAMNDNKGPLSSYERSDPKIFISGIQTTVMTQGYLLKIDLEMEMFGLLI